MKLAPATGLFHPGRVAIVTGAGGAIGAATAGRLSAHGVKVALADIDERRAGLAADRCPGSFALRVDVTKEDSCREAVAAALRRFGRLDIAVNCHGIGGTRAPLWELPAGTWEEVIRVNLTGVYHMCRAVLPTLLAAGYGRIVNVSSVAGKEGNPNAAPYSAAKAGVIGLTKAIAKEVAQKGILVNAIAPAAIESEMFRRVPKAQQDYVIAKIPMGRVGGPDEVAALITWLSSDECTFSTGAVFDVSGGRATY